MLTSGFFGLYAIGNLSQSEIQCQTSCGDAVYELGKIHLTGNNPTKNRKSFLLTKLKIMKWKNLTGSEIERDIQEIRTNSYPWWSSAVYVTFLKEPSGCSSEYSPFTTSPSRCSCWDLWSPVWGSSTEYEYWYLG